MCAGQPKQTETARGYFRCAEEALGCIRREQLRKAQHGHQILFVSRERERLTKMEKTQATSPLPLLVPRRRTMRARAPVCDSLSLSRRSSCVCVCVCVCVETTNFHSLGLSLRARGTTSETALQILRLHVDFSPHTRIALFKLRREQGKNPPITVRHRKME